MVDLRFVNWFWHCACKRLLNRHLIPTFDFVRAVHSHCNLLSLSQPGKPWLIAGQWEINKLDLVITAPNGVCFEEWFAMAMLCPLPWRLLIFDTCHLTHMCEHSFLFHCISATLHDSDVTVRSQQQRLWETRSAKRWNKRSNEEKNNQFAHLPAQLHERHGTSFINFSMSPSHRCRWSFCQEWLFFNGPCQSYQRLLMHWSSVRLTELAVGCRKKAGVCQLWMLWECIPRNAFSL